MPRLQHCFSGIIAIFAMNKGAVLQFRSQKQCSTYLYLWLGHSDAGTH